jgi:hypothetical protein
MDTAALKREALYIVLVNPGDVVVTRIDGCYDADDSTQDVAESRHPRRHLRSRLSQRPDGAGRL